MAADDRVRLVALGEDDEEWAWQVYCATTRADVEQVVDWPEDEHRRVRRRALGRGGMAAIHVDGERVGLVDVVEEGADLAIRHLELLPAAQGRGVGTHVVQQVIARAGAAGRGVTLRVQHVNPRAQSLYRRLGFVVVESRPETVAMRRPPDTGPG